jgi:hypothetical protein
MYNRARPYLPSIPYLIGVGLQVSGRTHFWLAFLAFELAAVISAGVIWSYWSDWHQTAVVGGHPNRSIQRVLTWPGFKIRRYSFSPQLFAALIVLFMGNALIGTFFGLTEQQQSNNAPIVSAHAIQLSKFYGELGGAFWTPMTKGTTPAQFEEWTKAVEDKEQEIIDWVRLNMGQPAVQRLADTHFQMPPPKFSMAINDKHNQLLDAIWVMQGNLKSLMETTVWDKQNGQGRK